jgi:hypothetical protein
LTSDEIEDAIQSQLKQENPAEIKADFQSSASLTFGPYPDNGASLLTRSSFGLSTP